LSSVHHCCLPPIELEGLKADVSYGGLRRSAYWVLVLALTVVPAAASAVFQNL
jgi:hypothetical protein